VRESPGPPWCLRGEFCTCQLSVIMTIKVTETGFLSSGFLRGKGKRQNLKLRIGLLAFKNQNLVLMTPSRYNAVKKAFPSGA